MGILSSRLGKVTAQAMENANKPRTFGIDAGGYVCQITDISLDEIKNGKNAGTPALFVTVKPRENWDGDKISNGPDIRSMVALTDKWASGSENFTLLQFLNAIGAYDADNEEVTLDFDDEAEAQDALMGVEVNCYIGYRVSQATDKYPARVFNEVSTWLQPEAELRQGKTTFQEETDKLASGGGSAAPNNKFGSPASGKDTVTKFSGFKRAK